MLFSHFFPQTWAKLDVTLVHLVSISWEFQDAGRVLKGSRLKRANVVRMESVTHSMMTKGSLSCKRAVIYGHWRQLL